MRHLTRLVVLVLVLACSGSEGTEAVFPSGGSGGATSSPPAESGRGGSSVGGNGGSRPSGGSGGLAAGAGGAAGGAGSAAGGGGGSQTDAAGPSDGGPISDTGPGSADVAPGDPGPDAAPGFVGNPFVYVGSSSSPDIRIFELDLGSGGLRAAGMARSGPSPNYLAFHPNGKYLYAISEQMGVGGRVYGFSINPQTGALSRINDSASGGAGPAHLWVHKSGRWLLVANYGSGHAAVVPISPEGALGAPVTPVVFAGRQAHMILDDGVSGKFVFVPSKGDLRTLMYRFDETTGALTPNDPPSVNQGGPARHMAFHRSGQYAYVLTEGQQLGRRIFSYRYDSATGLLSAGMPHVVSTNNSTDGAHILVHPTLDVVYASIRGLGATGGSGSVARLSIEEAGRLGPPAHVSTQIARPWDFAIDPAGRYLVVANNDAGNVRVFRIDQTSGALSLVGAGATVAQRPRFVGILYPPRAP